METEKFYELKIGATEVLLRVEPPEKGKRANLNDIQKELRSLDIPFRVDHLFDIYRRSSNQFETLTNRESDKFEILVQVAPGNQEASLTVIPPGRGEDELTPAKIKEALEAAKVEKGILYPELKRLMTEKIENKPIVIARGKVPIQGEDGTINFHIDQTDSKLGTVEDNRVDYRELNLVKNVHEGDLIATITPPTAGEDGFNVYGATMKGKNGKRAKFRLGPNTTVNEERTEIRAGKAGFVVINEDRISIEDVFEVENVDANTGNIRFTGVVRVNGQVEDNFLIQADKGIEVGGTVGKATLRSRGEIKIMGGAIGTTVETRKSVSAKFFNECQVVAGTNVIAEEYILHSDMQAGKIVQVKQTPTGFINGGTIRAGDSVWTAVLGSEVSEGHTKVEVGVGLGVRRQFQELQETVKVDQQNFERLCKNLRVLQSHRESKGPLPQEQGAALEKMLSAAKGLREKMHQEAQEHQSLFNTLSNQSDSDSAVFVSSVANPGARIQVTRFKVNLTSPLESCAFRILNGELKAQDFGQAQKAHKALRKKRSA